MASYRINKSEIVNSSPIKTVQLSDGRTVKKVVDKSYLRKTQTKSSNDTRSYVQLLFFLITLWIGIDFFLFVNGLKNGTLLQRPPGVEGFLPISALISLRYFLLTRIVNHVHPAGFFIFVAALFISTFMKKGFCSWICPIGYISESVNQLGEKLFGRNFKLYSWIDIPLRSIKYILMSFFIISISAMSTMELDAFIHSDYNKIADIKLYLFFAHITIFPLIVLGGLIFLSLFYKSFWCRYICPYGALLGIMSLISPLKIRRNADTCIDCGKCADVCPTFLPVDKLNVVNSAECMACYSCTEACPIKDTLKFSVNSRSGELTQKRYAILLLCVYFGIIGLAMLLGLWQNNISGQEYLQLFRIIGTINHGI
jgi:polyferredoxin